MKKNVLLATGVVAGVIAIAGMATTAANAQSGSTPSLADAIAKKFNLKSDDVKKVIDENHTARHQERQADQDARIKEKLAKLVSDKKLTQEQADKITAKRAELQKQMEADRATRQAEHDKQASMTEEQRKAAHDARKAEMDKKRTELNDWLKSNGIDTQYVHLLMSGGHGMGGKGGHMHGRGMERNSEAPASVQMQ